MAADTAIGIDVGGTHVRAAVVDGAGTILASTIAATPPEGEPEQLAELLARIVADIRAETTPTSGAVGVALPGIRDETGVVRRAVNLPRLEGVNARHFCEQALGRSVLVETDANAAGWAQWHGLDSRPQRFVYLTIGTGVGGCVILDGAIVRHTHDGPGHLGHLIVDTSCDAPKCRCGARGCLEALLADVNGPLARSLAIALVQIAHLYAPEIITLGGGKVDSAPELVDRTRAEFDALKGTLVPSEIQLLRAPLSSNEAGVSGAALLAMQT